MSEWFSLSDVFFTVTSNIVCLGNSIRSVAPTGSPLDHLDVVKPAEISSPRPKKIVQVTSPGLLVYSSLYQMKQHETIKDWNPRFAVEHGPIFFQSGV